MTQLIGGPYVLVAIPLKPGPTAQPRCSYGCSGATRADGSALSLPRQRRRDGVRHALALDRDRLRSGSGDTPTTFGAIAARWLAVKAATKRESTVVFYESTLRNHVLPASAPTPCRHIELHAATKAELHPLTAEQVTEMAAAVRPATGRW